MGHSENRAEHSPGEGIKTIPNKPKQPDPQPNPQPNPNSNASKGNTGNPSQNGTKPGGPISSPTNPAMTPTNSNSAPKATMDLPPIWLPKAGTYTYYTVQGNEMDKIAVMLEGLGIEYRDFWKFNKIVHLPIPSTGPLDWTGVKLSHDAGGGNHSVYYPTTDNETIGAICAKFRISNDDLIWFNDKTGAWTKDTVILKKDPVLIPARNAYKRQGAAGGSGPEEDMDEGGEPVSDFPTDIPVPTDTEGHRVSEDTGIFENPVVSSNNPNDSEETT